MTEPKHTPLPWKKIRTGEETVGSGYTVRPYYSLCSPKGVVIAHIFSSGFSVEEFEANVELLFSAPAQQAEIERLKRENDTDSFAYVETIDALTAHVEQLREMAQVASNVLYGSQHLSNVIRSETLAALRAALAETEPKDEK